MCLRARTCASVNEDIHAHVCAHRGQRATSSVIPWVPSSSIYNRVSHRPETYQAGRLIPGICPSLLPSF